MNKHKYKIITINGIRGVIVVGITFLCLIAGFIISPGWVCMKVWNYFAADSNVVSLMNIYQGIMLWAIIVLSLYAVNRNKEIIGFNSFQGLSSEEIQEILNKAQTNGTSIVKNIDLQSIQFHEHKIISEPKEEEKDEEMRK